ncbi:CheR family methyltransferase [Clostridium septicum]|uniref:protein-glutamate O-methyltransferase n=1 Tax=Clostridium septicum TaxID=1504 RepID=A0A9N7JJ80_CLOSE|nr:protein-glutamate O-methyltransferase CheR [Clostridium septicum]AYE33458.1 chemotaxis protein CheR [Clostridium septicum]MDU1314778.1 protein-glutamate O-methyltransferase CheR [Clostridium septicum]QAS61629.1 protein-glutamate O-methyltransferase CheR [Clostridium septicum]UEC21931.1 protein-glutamate O-methyltransferase CheR [Clostridium septicum]USS00038.1 protein-glutamate O-methyltransferase CheR [Clostridium septicum]
MDFNDFHQWVFKELGVNLNAYKPEQLNRRIGSLMSRVGVKSLEEYKIILSKDKEQRERFLDFITINVTEFFRNPEIFKQLEEAIKNELLTSNSKIKVWSAACSIGCEPYSLGILLKELNPLGRNTILATDIDKGILEKAKLGEYTLAEMKNVREEYINKYFKNVDNKYIIDSNIKSMITFKRHDLILDTYERDFDLIVCRNVVIYFKNDVKNEIFNKFSNSLKKGGLLFIGATESIYNYKDYNLEKVSTFIYKKI